MKSGNIRIALQDAAKSDQVDSKAYFVHSKTLLRYTSVLDPCQKVVGR